jgi:DNA/RNA endonuclease YhcR with UshA esterase domain
MAAPQPGIGDWYRLNGGELFEVVAINDGDGTIDIQYFDGTVEEMDQEDWSSQWDEGVLEAAEPPEDWSGSVDVEGGDEEGRGSDSINEDPTLRASPLDGLDLFE